VLTVNSAGVSCKLAFVLTHDHPGNNTMKWVSTEPGKPNVRVAFTRTSNPFSNTQVLCDGSKPVCQSGPPTENFAGAWNIIYLYDVSVCAADGSDCTLAQDPGIIIKP